MITLEYGYLRVLGRSSVILWQNTTSSGSVAIIKFLKFPVVLEKRTLTCFFEKILYSNLIRSSHKRIFTSVEEFLQVLPFVGATQAILDQKSISSDFPSYFKPRCPKDINAYICTRETHTGS